MGVDVLLRRNEILSMPSLAV